MVSSLWTRLATRRGFLAARAAASNWSAKARVAVRVAASCSVMPYSAIMRARRASGSSGSFAATSAWKAGVTMSGGRSGSGK